LKLASYNIVECTLHINIGIWSMEFRQITIQHKASEMGFGGREGIVKTHLKEARVLILTVFNVKI
jgi:hypothetical protein